MKPCFVALNFDGVTLKVLKVPMPPLIRAYMRGVYKCGIYV